MAPVNPAADLAATFRPPAEDPAEVFEMGELIKPVTVRMPAGRYCWVRAMAEQSGRSVTGMSNELIRVGLSSVLAHIDPDVRQAIEERVGELVDAHGIAGIADLEG